MSLMFELSNDGKNLTSTNGYMDFTTRFAKSIELEGEWEVALHSLFTWFSFFNCSAQLGNNVVAYNNGVADKTVTFPDGNYTLGQLEAELHRQMKANGDYTVVDGVDTFDIQLKPNYSTLRVEITLSNGYTLDLTQSTFNILIGFDSVVVSTNGVNVGTQLADITNEIDNLIINCDIVSGSYRNGSDSSGIYHFKPVVPPGSSILVEPVNKIFLKVDTNQIKTIRIWLTDQKQRPLNLNGEGLTAVLHCRMRKQPTESSR